MALEDSKMKTWILLDGHHKVEAAARMGCSLNFLVISPCAEPYTPLETADEFASSLTRRMKFPFLWPRTEEELCVRWPAAKLCRHSPLLLSSSREPPEAWQDALGCSCFCKDESFPKWAFQLMGQAWPRKPSRQKLMEKLWEHFGKDHELFTMHSGKTMGELPEDLRPSYYELGITP
eukprot:Skav230289  [mRNA]  locus=scaffold2934:75919:77129:- [translate_table: standard]